MPVTKYEKRIEKYKNSINNISQNGLTGSDKLRTAFQNLVTKIEEIKEEKLENVDRTEAVMAEMTKLYSDCMKEVEEYENANTYNVLYSKEEREQMRKIKNAIGKDVTALNSYTRAQKESVNFVPKNFETILEEGRAKKMTVNLSDVEHAGAAQSDRLVLADENRGVVYFTESKPGKSRDQQIRDLLEETKKKYSGKANFIYNNLYLDVFKTLATNRDCLKNANNPLLSQDERLDQIRNGFEDENVFNAIRYLSNSEEKEIFLECADKVSKIALSTGLNQSNGIRQNSKQDKRNSAMSMTADLLGMGDVIAHSENTKVEFTDATGKVKKTVMGTAMDQAVGADKKESGLAFSGAGVFTQEFNFRNYSLSAIENNKYFIRDVARLQVLDYICGNPDRHSANLVYKFDNDGKIVGLQGIDNDTSFGSNFKPGGNRSVSIANMQVIPKSTADMIEATDAESFRLMLYGYDLTKDEVDAAVERFDTIKSTIKTSKQFYNNEGLSEGVLVNGFPRVVDDDKLGEYSVEQQLAKSSVSDGKKKHLNTFSLLCNGASAMGVTQNMMNNNLDKAKETTNEFLRTGMLAMQKSFLRLDSVDKWYHTGSDEYTDMKKDIENVVSDVKKYDGGFLVAGQKMGKAGIDYELSPAAKKMKEDIKKALDSTNTYINKKEKVKASDDPKDQDMKRKLADEKSRTYKRYKNALTNRTVLEAQYERFVKIEAYLKMRRVLANDTKTMEDIEAKDDIARRKASEKLRENTVRNEIREVEKYCKENLKLINDKRGVVSDEIKLRAALDYTVLTGLMPVSIKSMKTVSDEKDKDPKQYEKLKRGIAACIVGEKMIRLKKQEGDNKKKPNRKPNDNDRLLEKMQDVNTDNIKDVDSLMKCVDNVMKSKTFETAFNKIVSEGKELPPESLNLYTNDIPDLKLSVYKDYANTYRAEVPEPEKAMVQEKNNVQKKNEEVKKK